MKKRTIRTDADHPAIYQIEILGKLGQEWSTSFDNLELRVDDALNGRVITTICGLVTDQAALHGLLNQIRDLGMVLLRVERISNGS